MHIFSSRYLKAEVGSFQFNAFPRNPLLWQGHLLHPETPKHTTKHDKLIRISSLIPLCLKYLIYEVEYGLGYAPNIFMLKLLL